MSLRVYSIRDFEPRPLLSSVSIYVLIVWYRLKPQCSSLSRNWYNTYIKSKIMKCWLRILGIYLKKSPPFSQKMARKPRFHDGTSPEKLRFTENNRYGWIDIKMLSSKLVELAGKLARDGWKITRTGVVVLAHALSTCRVFHRTATKLQACSHQQLLSLLVWRVCSEAAWSTTKMNVVVDGEKEREREMYMQVFWVWPIGNWSVYIKW